MGLDGAGQTETMLEQANWQEPNQSTILEQVDHSLHNDHVRKRTASSIA